MSLDSILRELFSSDIDFDNLNLSDGTIEELIKLKTRYSKMELSESTRDILNFLQENYSNREKFSCKDIGEKMLLSPKAVSGSMQKLVRLGYVEKLGGKPVLYRYLTSKERLSKGT